ncbi:kinase-like domain-containing protein, partial [Fusarium oxysporum Fo47]
MTSYPNQKRSPYVLGEHCGTGQSPVNRVWKVASPKDESNPPFAQKTITLENDLVPTEEVRSAFLQEVKVLRHAEHQHIVEFVEAFALGDPPNKLALVMRFASNGSMADYLGNKLKYPEAHWFSCLLSAVDYIHGMGIRHRDIKPANILVDGNKAVRLADFGISRMGIGITLSTSVPEWARGRTKTFCAPEVENGSSRGRSADIFSLGAVFLKMVTAYSRHLISELATALKYSEGPSFTIRIAEVHKFMAKLSSEPPSNWKPWQMKIVSMCMRMLQEDRDDRPTSGELFGEITSLQDEGLL